ncbi:DUF4358 domain-containing protein [Oscillospiraceae bacterium LTW-04]|nr:DUF4358 domain-containing protein [Oscillospiraceae bacterium MB24-C1]
MKKIIAAALCCIMLSIMFAGCGASKKELDMDSLSTDVLSKGSFNDELILLSDKVVGDYYDLSFEGLDEYRVYVSSSSATASEFALFKCSSDAALKSAKAAVEARISDQISNYENYRPDEKFRLENALIETNGNYLLLVVSDNNDTIQKLFNEALK